MYLQLYFDSACKVFNSRENEGFPEVLALLDRLVKVKRGIEVEIRDTGGLSEEDRTDTYSKAAAVSAVKKYRIRQVFGSRRRSGSFFGKEVPALLVYERKGASLQDVYPREEKGRVVTIKEFLEKLLAQ